MVAGAALLAIAAALWLGSPPTQTGSGDFWERLRIQGREVEHYPTLAEMLSASDAVVVARIVGVEISREIHGDPPSDIITLGRLNLEVVSVLFGDAPAIVPLEFLLGPTPESAAVDLRSLQASVPSGTALYFLHEKRGSGEQGLYRVTNSTGLWSETSRARLDAPLRELSPEEGQLYAGELIGVDTVEDLIKLLRGYASGR